MIAGQPISISSSLIVLEELKEIRKRKKDLAIDALRICSWIISSYRNWQWQ
jgi:hypothetical protein